MGKGASRGLMEYVLVSFYAILLLQLWFAFLNSSTTSAQTLCFQQPEILEPERAEWSAPTSWGSSGTCSAAGLGTGE